MKTVFLEIGKLSNVEPDAMRFSFSVVTRGSLAENATLEIIEVVGQAWCLKCEQNVVITNVTTVVRCAKAISCKLPMVSKCELKS